MKNVIRILALLAIGACNHAPLKVGGVKDAATASVPSTQTASATATQTESATQTPTDTETSTSTATAPVTVTTVVTATTTATATATVAALQIDFTTAFHSAGMIDVKPGDKGIIFGTFLFSNKSAGKVTVKDTQVGFIDSSDPRMGNEWADSEAAGHAKLVSDHLTNCVLRGWPETKVYAGPVNPNQIARADMHDEFDVPPFDGTNALALDAVCDITNLKVDSEVGFAVEFMDAEDVQAYDGNGNRAKIVRGSMNGSPPKVAAVIAASGSFGFCPVDDSTISQTCCAYDGATFAKTELSDLVQQPNAYTLIKGSNSLVYLYATDGKRYVFPNKDVITSWFTSFDGGQLGDLQNVCSTVNEIPDIELAAMTIGGNVTIRPGSYIVKIASDAKLYVVSKGKVLRWLSTPDLAEQLYPGTSAQRIRIVPDAFFTNYYIGQEVQSTSDYDPAAEWSSANLETESQTK